LNFIELNHYFVRNITMIEICLICSTIPLLTDYATSESAKTGLHKHSRYSQGRWQKIFQGEGAPTEKRPENSIVSLFRGEGRGQRKKDRKIALLSLYLLYLYHVWKSRRGTAPPAAVHGYSISN